MTFHGQTGNIMFIGASTENTKHFFDEMQVDQQEVKQYVADKDRKYITDHVISRCPTHALSLNDDATLAVDNPNCVRCMHCLNVMPKALSPGRDRGFNLLIGGNRTLKIGDRFATVVVPFMKLESDEDYDRLVEIAENTIDFFSDNALEPERIGWPQFFELTELPFTRFHIDDWRGAQKSLNASSYLRF